MFSGAMRVFWTRIDQRRFPWAYASSGRPPLVGTWVGSLATTRGTRRGLYLDLRLVPLRFRHRGRRRVRNGAYRSATSDKLSGELRLCGGPAGEQRFVLHGNNETDDASRFRLSFSPADSAPPDGLAPSHLRGAWDERDSLDVAADLYLRHGISAITGGADPETGRPTPGGLHRGSESDYRALCARIGRGQR